MRGPPPPLHIANPNVHGRAVPIRTSAGCGPHWPTRRPRALLVRGLGRLCPCPLAPRSHLAACGAAALPWGGLSRARPAEVLRPKLAVIVNRSPEVDLEPTTRAASRAAVCLKGFLLPARDLESLATGRDGRTSGRMPASPNPAIGADPWRTYLDHATPPGGGTWRRNRWRSAHVRRHPDVASQGRLDISGAFGPWGPI